MSGTRCKSSGRKIYFGAIIVGWVYLSHKCQKSLIVWRISKGHRVKYSSKLSKLTLIKSFAQNFAKHLIKDFRTKDIAPKSPKDIVPHSKTYDNFGVASTCYASVAAVWLG